MRVSAKVDYALRATAELAAAQLEAAQSKADRAGTVKGERLAASQQIPLNFLENILLELRRSGIVASQRGAEGGYWLAKPTTEVTIADVIRAVEGPDRDRAGGATRGRRLHRRCDGASGGLDRAAGEHARRTRDDDARRPRGEIRLGEHALARRLPAPRPLDDVRLDEFVDIGGEREGDDVGIEADRPC